MPEVGARRSRQFCIRTGDCGPVAVRRSRCSFVDGVRGSVSATLATGAWSLRAPDDGIMLTLDSERLARFDSDPDPGRIRHIDSR